MANAWLLLAPAGLIGLLAIAIPIAIHLISRGRGRRVLIGNIELVRAARQARVTTPRLTEWLLLLLRLLIVVVATLLLARLALQGLGSVDGKATYVTPGWLGAATEAERSDLLAREPPARVLASNFPLVEEFDATADDSAYDAWPLLAERLSTRRHSGTVEVFAERRADLFGERRPFLPNEVNWHLATARGGTKTFETRGLVVHDRDRTDAVRRLEDALEALQRYRLPRLEWTVCAADDVACQDGRPDWVAWLSADEPPGQFDGPRLFRPQAGEWAEAVSDPRFPERLLDTVLSEVQQREVWEQVPVSAATLSAGAQVASGPLPYRSMQPWLGALLILLWTAERLLSERRRSRDA
jgi:hypothetical protein